MCESDERIFFFPKHPFKTLLIWWCVTLPTMPMEQKDTKSIQKAFIELLKCLIHLAMPMDWMTVRMIDWGTGQLYFPSKVTVVCPLFLECKARGLTSTFASDLVALVKDNALYLALYHPASMALCFAWMWPLCCSFVDISLSVRGFSCLPPNTWQDDVAFALGNIQVPQSLTLGASVAIQRTSEWWTGSFALPGCIPFAPKCVFCWYLWLSFFPGCFSPRSDATGLQG